jgi:hypothetical protein
VYKFVNNDGKESESMKINDIAYNREYHDDYSKLSWMVVPADAVMRYDENQMKKRWYSTSLGWLQA